MPILSFKGAGRVVIGCLLAATLIFFTRVWWQCNFEKEIAFLPDHQGANWILYPKAVEGITHDPVELSTVFSRAFVLPAAPARGQLLVRAMRRYTIAVNGNGATDGSLAIDNWKAATAIDIAAKLHAGTNEIAVTVFNSNGPPALWLLLDADGNRLASDESWESSLWGAEARPAKLASVASKLDPSNKMYSGERPWPSLLWLWPWIATCGGVVLILGWLGPRWRRGGAMHAGAPTLLQRFAAAAPVLPALLWAALYWHNGRLLPGRMGFDAYDHLRYIEYVRNHWTIPFGNQGWQMYQPPLYYFVSALLLAPFHVGVFSQEAVAWLRALGFLAGMAHFTLVFLSLRILFPGRTGAQWFGLLLAAFVPESLYLVHYVTNEVLAAAFVTAAVYLCLRIMKEERKSPVWFAALGACMGAGLLAKFTALLAVPLIAGVLVWWFARREPGALRSWAGKIGVTMVAALLVCGWYYIRVWMRFGKPIVGNWDPACGFSWWMEDGYHTAGWFFRFGDCLVHPWHAGMHGFVDGLYSTLWGDGLWGGMVDAADRPPWNYDLMAAGFVLALGPTLVILVGAARALRRIVLQPEPMWILVVGLGILTLAAVISMSIKLPFYAQAKSFYGLCALLPLCAFGALGWEWLSRLGRKAALPVAAVLGTWAMFSYAAYWIREDTAETQMVIGRMLDFDDLKAEAGRHNERAVELEPRNARARSLLAARNPVRERALGELEAAVAEAPLDAGCHSRLAAALNELGQPERAIAEARRAVDLAPDHGAFHQPLCAYLANQGHYAEAVTAGRAGLRVNPFNGELHYVLGRAYAGLAQQPEALAHLSRAVLLKPDWADAHDQFGMALSESGRWPEALEEFTRAIQLGSNAVAFHFHRAVTEEAASLKAEAIGDYRRALELNPNFPSALNNLAWLMATDPDPQFRNGQEAVNLASKACALTERKIPFLLGTLAAAQAESGRFEDAVAVASEAARLAESSGDASLAATNRALMEQYRAKRPFHRE